MGDNRIDTSAEDTGRLTKALADARDEVARLERAVAGAPCHEVGCDMRSVGGCNAGCGDGCGCSVPVFVCTRCGDSDYGDNEEARRTRADCAALSHNKDADHG